MSPGYPFPCIGNAGYPFPWPTGCPFTAAVVVNVPEADVFTDVVVGWFTPPPPFKAPWSAISLDNPSTPCESTGSNKLFTKSLTSLGDSSLSEPSDCIESLSPVPLLEEEDKTTLPPFTADNPPFTIVIVTPSFSSFSTNAWLARLALRRISLIISLSSSCRGPCWTSTLLLFSCTTRACIADSNGSSWLSWFAEAELPVDSTFSRASRIFFALATTSAIDNWGSLSRFFFSPFLTDLPLSTTAWGGGITGGGGGGGGGINAGAGGGGGGTNTWALGEGGEAVLLPSLVLCTRPSSTWPW